MNKNNDGFILYNYSLLTGTRAHMATALFRANGITWCGLFSCAMCCHHEGRDVRYFCLNPEAAKCQTSGQTVGPPLVRTLTECTWMDEGKAESLVVICQLLWGNLLQTHGTCTVFKFQTTKTDSSIWLIGGLFGFHFQSHAHWLMSFLATKPTSRDGIKAVQRRKPAAVDDDDDLWSVPPH